MSARITSRKVKRSMVGWTQTFNRDGTPKDNYKSCSSSFDVQGNQMEDIRYDKNGKIQIRTVFDERGNVSEETHFNPNETVNFRYVYRYDEAGNQIEKAMYLANNRFHGRWTSRLDESGKPIEETWYNSKNEIEVSDKYEYLQGGKVTRKARGNVATWTYTYDGNGNLRSVRGGYYSSDETDDISFKYDERQLLIKKTVRYPTGETKSVTVYQYDFYE